MNDINDQDKLMAALSYPIGIVAIIILLVEDMKKRHNLPPPKNTLLM